MDASILISIMVVLVLSAFFSWIASIASRIVRSRRSSGRLEGSDSDSALTSYESEGQQKQPHHHHDHFSAGWGGGHQSSGNDFGGGHHGGGGDLGGGGGHHG